MWAVGTLLVCTGTCLCVCARACRRERGREGQRDEVHVCLIFFWEEGGLTTSTPCFSAWVRYTRRVPSITDVNGAKADIQKNFGFFLLCMHFKITLLLLTRQLNYAL